ncbi:hypothetical protein GQ44DRAFT_765179 [Phaeosphaeriaceae sp. PMI808]|nr:hypothetical protein GQ44DRAFT_765179 [Phaeosphaeriaceae sp. PMI808]
MASKTHPQQQSSLLTRLPREILDKIYLEVWRAYGLRQHILFHGKGPLGKDKHFCRWKCCTEFRVNDPLQADVEQLRAKLNVLLGSDIQGTQPPEIGVYCRRLMSPWMDHWLCGERAMQEHGMEAISSYTTSDKCWRTWRDNRPDASHTPDWSPYLPMLLTCKLVSAQCLKSIYESITFIFTDLSSIQAWFGHCQLQPEWEILFEGHVTPQLFTNFGKSFICTMVMMGLPQAENPHDGYDFHWLHLSRFEALHTVKIWINARSKSIRFDPNEIVFGIKELDVKALTSCLSSFENIASVVISTPLGPSFEPEEGIVQNLSVSNVTLYKRGRGDKFHPWLNLINDKREGYYNNLIHTCRTPQVRLAINGGNHHIMGEV